MLSHMRQTLLASNFTQVFVVMAAMVMTTPMSARAETERVQNIAPAKQQLATSSLPGVKPAKPIVAPAEAEPDENHSRANPDGSIMIGNTRVKISGSVIVDVGNDALPRK